MSDQHVDYLLSLTPDEFFRWHSRKERNEIVQSLYVVLEELKLQRQLVPLKDEHERHD